MTPKQSKRNEIKELYKLLDKANEKAMRMTKVDEIKEHLHRVAEIRMRISVLEGEINY
jgi:hypothetical protein